MVLGSTIPFVKTILMFRLTMLLWDINLQLAIPIIPACKMSHSIGKWIPQQQFKV